MSHCDDPRRLPLAAHTDSSHPKERPAWERLARSMVIAVLLGLVGGILPAATSIMSPLLDEVVYYLLVIAVNYGVYRLAMRMARDRAAGSTSSMSTMVQSHPAIVMYVFVLIWYAAILVVLPGVFCEQHHPLAGDAFLLFSLLLSGFVGLTFLASFGTPAARGAAELIVGHDSRWFFPGQPAIRGIFWLWCAFLLIYGGERFWSYLRSGPPMRELQREGVVVTKKWSSYSVWCTDDTPAGDRLANAAPSIRRLRGSINLYLTGHFSNVDALRNMKNLRELKMQSDKLARIDGLTGCLGLEEIEMFDCPRLVDIHELAALPHLKRLFISRCGVAAGRVGELRRALPKTYFYFSEK
jgi:hypothetical protein